MRPNDEMRDIAIKLCDEHYEMGVAEAVGYGRKLLAYIVETAGKSRKICKHCGQDFAPGDSSCAHPNYKGAQCEWKAPKTTTILIAEEVEVGGGYHNFWVLNGKAEVRGWGEPYAKTGSATYRMRVVAVEVPSE